MEEKLILKIKEQVEKAYKKTIEKNKIFSMKNHVGGITKNVMEFAIEKNILYDKQELNKNLRLEFEKYKSPETPIPISFKQQEVEKEIEVEKEAVVLDLRHLNLAKDDLQLFLSETYKHIETRMTIAIENFLSAFESFKRFCIDNQQEDVESYGKLIKTFKEFSYLIDLESDSDLRKKCRRLKDVFEDFKVKFDEGLR